MAVDFSEILKTGTEIYDKYNITPQEKYELELAKTQAQARTAEVNNNSQNNSSNIFTTQNILIGGVIIVGGYLLLK